MAAIHRFMRAASKVTGVIRPLPTLHRFVAGSRIAILLILVSGCKASEDGGMPPGQLVTDRAPSGVDTNGLNAPTTVKRRIPAQHSELASAIKSRFQSWNPILDTVWALDGSGLFADVATATSVPNITYVLARAIRADQNFSGSFDDEAYGVFAVDQELKRITETVGFIPTCRWSDCLAELLSVWPDSVTVALSGATYGDAADTILLRHFGHNELTVTPAVFGPITQTTSEADLIARFGAAAVLQEDLDLGEGFCSSGTVLFPDHPNRLEIMWKDDRFLEPVTVRSWGNGSDWQTPDGVSVGTELPKLEAIRGAPVAFSGFDWDYGGRMGWQLEGGTVAFQLNYDQEDMTAAAQHPRFGETLGDRDVQSDHPVIKLARIWIDMMYVNWGYPSNARDCT